MGERSILSYFPSSGKAQDAKAELEQLGYQDMQIDRISRYPSDLRDSLNSPLSGDISSLTNLTQSTAAYDDAAVLMSSDPAVSGMSSEQIAGRHPFILTVVTDDEHVETAVQIIKKHGGYV